MLYTIQTLQHPQRNSGVAKRECSPIAYDPLRHLLTLLKQWFPHPRSTPPPQIHNNVMFDFIKYADNATYNMCPSPLPDSWGISIILADGISTPSPTRIPESTPGPSSDVNVVTERGLETPSHCKHSITISRHSLRCWGTAPASCLAWQPSRVETYKKCCF